MKAVAIRGYGGVEQVALMELVEPRPAPGEVLVRIHAAALNHLDLWTLSGSLALPIEFPFVLGADGAGEIAEVGEHVAGISPGDRVVINPGISCRRCEHCRAGEQSRCAKFQLLGEHLPGTFAELIAVPAENVFPMPEHLSMLQAAALPVTFGTAYRMLFTAGRLRPGESVLITGIGGGLASAALQLARSDAENVVVTSSSVDKLERALELGADAGLNYTQDDIAVGVRRLTSQRGVDLVIDSAGGASIDISLRCLRAGGRLVISGATAGGTAEFNVRRLFWNHLHIVGSTMASDTDMALMLRAVAGMRLEPVIDRTYPLAEAASALDFLASQGHFGKIVLEL